MGVNRSYVGGGDNGVETVLRGEPLAMEPLSARGPSEERINLRPNGIVRLIGAKSSG